MTNKDRTAAKQRHFMQGIQGSPAHRARVATMGPSQANEVASQQAAQQVEQANRQAEQMRLEEKAEFAARERRQEEAAYRGKMERDRQLARTPVPAEFQDKPAQATDKQLAFITSLINEREITDEAREQFEERIANTKAGRDNGISKKRASEFIERLLALPKASATRVINASPRYDEVPDGHYALEMPGDSLNPIHFYIVDTGKDGTRWEGFQFVDRYASDETYPVKGTTRTEVMERLAADPKAAAVLYGHETERCCLCHRKLTRKESREAGIGPVCAGKVGW